MTDGWIRLLDDGGQAAWPPHCMMDGRRWQWMMKASNDIDQLIGDRDWG